MSDRIITPYGMTHMVDLLSRQSMDRKKMASYNALFRPEARHANETLFADIDVVSGSLKILPNLGVTDPSTVIVGEEKDTLTIKMPRISPIRPIPVTKVRLTQREPGTNMGTNMQKEIRRSARAGLQRITSTKLYMGMQSVLGKISMPGPSGAMREVANWSLPDDHTIQHADAADLWTVNTSSPVGDVRTAKNVIRESVQGEPDEWIALIGKNVLTALESHTDIAGDGGTASKKKIMKKLEIDQLFEADSHYKDPVSGTSKQFIDADTFILVGWAPEFMGEEYRSPESMMQEYAEMRRLIGEPVPENTDIPMEDLAEAMIFARLHADFNPLVLHVVMEAYCLPTVYAPGCTATILPLSVSA